MTSAKARGAWTEPRTIITLVQGDCSKVQKTDLSSYTGLASWPPQGTPEILPVEQKFGTLKPGIPDPIGFIRNSPV